MPPHKRAYGYKSGSNRLGGPEVPAFDPTQHLHKPPMPAGLAQAERDNGFDVDEDDQPAKKKPRKAKKAKPVEGEKRLARWKSKAPRAAIERASRAMSQRIFLIDRSGIMRDAAGVPSETYKVVGSAGNIYTIRISLVPSCDCPDAAKGHQCKHIFLVLRRVLGVPASSSLWYQKALLKSELDQLFANARPDPRVVDRELEAAYAAATGNASTSTAAAPEIEAPDADADCPVCYEDFSDSPVVQLWTDTNGCRKHLHKDCFDMWAKSAAPNVTCPWCRNPVQTGGAAAGPSGIKLGTSAEGYINVYGGAVQRDTSSYYHGPTRGVSRRNQGAYHAGRY